MVEHGDQGKDVPQPRGRPGEAVRSAMLWNLAHHGVSQLISAGVFLYLASRLDPVVFGVFALATVLSDAFAVEARSAAVDLTVAGRRYAGEALSTIFYCLLAAAAVAYAAVIAASFGLGALLQAPGLTVVAGVVGLNIFLAPRLAIHEALAVGELRFRALALRNISASLVSAAVAVLTVTLGADEWALVAQRLSASAVGLFTLARLAPWRPTAQFDRDSVPALARAFGKLWVSQLVTFGLGRAPDLLIGVRLGAAELGVYRVAARVVDIVQQAVTSPLSSLLVPVLSRFSGDLRAQAEQHRQIAALVSLLIAPAQAGLCVIAPDLVHSILAPEYARSGMLIAVLAGASLAAPFAHFRSGVLVSAGRPGMAASLALLDLAVTAGAIWVGAGRDLLWAAWGVLGASWVMAAISAVFTAQVLQTPLGSLLRACAPPYVAAAVMTAALYASASLVVDWSPAWRLAAAIPAGGAFFLSFLRLAYRDWLAERIRYLRATRPAGGNPNKGGELQG